MYRLQILMLMTILVVTVSCMDIPESEKPSRFFNGWFPRLFCKLTKKNKPLNIEFGQNKLNEMLLSMIYTYLAPKDKVELSLTSRGMHQKVIKTANTRYQQLLHIYPEITPAFQKIFLYRAVLHMHPMPVSILLDIISPYYPHQPPGWCFIPAYSDSMICIEDSLHFYHNKLKSCAQAQFQSNFVRNELILPIVQSSPDLRAVVPGIIMPFLLVIKHERRSIETQYITFTLEQLCIEQFIKTNGKLSIKFKFNQNCPYRTLVERGHIEGWVSEISNHRLLRLSLTIDWSWDNKGTYRIEEIYYYSSDCFITFQYFKSCTNPITIKL